MPPTFDEEVIIYADLQAKYIKVVKSVFDALGHYSRWDLVSLNGPPAPYEPVTTRRPTEAEVPELELERIVDSVSREFRLERERVEEVVTGLVHA